MDNIVSLEEMINQTTNDVKHNMKFIHSDGEIERFKKYFEDIVLYEEIACINKYNVKTYADDEKVSNNIKSSLIASGIKIDGNLEPKENISSLISALNTNNLLFAKKRAQELEKEYLGNDFGYKTFELANDVSSHEEIIDPSQLLKVGVCMQDRMSGYVEDHSGYNNSYILYAKKAWNEEKQKYIKEGLTDKPYYRILNDVFEKDSLKHYTLVHRKALEHAARITYKVDNDVLITENELEELHRFNDASKVLNEDVLDKYKIKINQVNKKNKRKIKSKK